MNKNQDYNKYNNKIAIQFFLNFIFFLLLLLEEEWLPSDVLSLFDEEELVNI